METIITSGVVEQVAALSEVEKEAKAWGEVDIEERAKRIASKAKNRVHVKSGDLQSSIGVGKLKRRGEFDSYVEVGSLREIRTLPDGRATFEEYGTKKQQAYPFLRPSVEEEFA